MRASRLLSIQMLLETRGRMSARALSEALEVSVRTLHRDIDQLSASGVPVFAERGRAGGFQLMDGWKTRLTGLTPSEAQAVFLSGLAGPAAELGLGPTMKGAQLKLLTALPEAWRDDAQKVQARFHLDPVDWYREAAPAPHLSTVAEAVWGERQLAMRYERWDGEVDRVVSPLGLVLKAGTWYFVAAATKASINKDRKKPGADSAARTYRVSNLLSAQALEAPARRPKTFDLARHWNESVKRFETELYSGEVEVLATPSGLRSLRELHAAAARAVAAAAARGEPRQPDGRVRLRLPVEAGDHAAAQLMRLAPEVEVTGPAALREAVIARLHRAAALYGLVAAQAEKAEPIKPAAASRGTARSARRPPPGRGR